MSGRICNDYANALLAHAFKISAMTPATHLNLALSTADPLADGSGLVEPTDANYARQQVDAWTANTGSRQVGNTDAINFPAAATGYGAITHYALIDNNGLFVSSGPLTAPVTVGAGVVFTVAIGAALIDMA